MGPHRQPPRHSGRPVPPRVSESVSQLSPAVRHSRNHSHRQGQAEARVSSLGHAVGDLARTTGLGRFPETGSERRGTGSTGGGANRHRGRPRHARRQTPTVGQHPEAECVSAVEMPGCEEPRKTKLRFPSVPTALGNRRRDSHIPTAPTITALSKPKPRKEPSPYPLSPRPFRLILR